SPAGDTGFHLMQMHVMRCPLNNLIDIILAFRSRPYYRHIAFDDIKKLRYFVKAGFADKPTNGSNPAVGSAAQLRSVFLGADIHRSELENIKRLFMQTYPNLSEKNGARRTEFYENYKC